MGTTAWTYSTMANLDVGVRGGRPSGRLPAARHLWQLHLLLLLLPQVALQKEVNSSNTNEIVV